MTITTVYFRSMHNYVKYMTHIIRELQDVIILIYETDKYTGRITITVWWDRSIISWKACKFIPKLFTLYGVM